MGAAKEYIGNKIRVMRKSRSMTQEDLAKAICQSASSITMYETGRREPDFETLEALADVFNIPLIELIPVAEDDRDFADDIPQTEEAKILSKGIDKLPKEQREQALAMFKLMFAPQYADLFNKGEEDDT